MKRIHSIQFYDYRGFYQGRQDNYLVKPESKNLLIYGENGSGKTSFFNGVKDFFNSSIDQVDFVKHNRSTNDNNGFVKINFDDETEEIFSEDGVSIPTQEFIKGSTKYKSFLTYRELLKTYFVEKDDELNFVTLIMQGLLKDHDLNTLGKLGEAFYRLNNYSYDDATNEILYRKDISKDQIKELIEKVTSDDLLNLAQFNEELEGLLNDVNIELKKLLKYFDKNLSAQLKCNKEKITDRTKLGEYKIYLDVKHYQKQINDYHSILNEARLSALAITIYLASILKNPTQSECKILFLDDIFIGLDMSNRIPLLEIIQKEFSGWQVFITTYDRQLYELARRQFEIHSPDLWCTYEFYTGLIDTGSDRFEGSIIVQGESNYEKAVRFLHNDIKPDYPASANYFRKALEEIIQTFIPKWETVDAEKIQIPDYKLTTLISIAANFLQKTSNDITIINQIIGFLPTLLHPLSHFEITSQVYKGELVRIESALEKLRSQLKFLEITSNYKCSLEKGAKIKITYLCDTTLNKSTYYELIINDPIVLINNTGSTPDIAKVKCYTYKCYDTENGTITDTYHPLKNNPNFNYVSLQDAYDRIYTHLTSRPDIGHFPKSTNYVEVIEFLDINEWKPLINLIVWESNSTNGN